MFHPEDDKCLVQDKQCLLCFQGHVVDRSVYLYIQSLYVAWPLGRRLILPLCSEVIAQT